MGRLASADARFDFSNKKQFDEENNMKLRTLAIVAGLSLAAAVPATAHHSFAMFANDKTVSLDGTVKDFEWVNPHSWVYLTVTNDKGVPEDWAFEMGSPGQLASHGWTKNTVKVGDKITMVAHPMKDGSHGGSETQVKLANGTVIGGAGAAGGGGRAAAPGGARGAD